MTYCTASINAMSDMIPKLMELLEKYAWCSQHDLIPAIALGVLSAIEEMAGNEDARTRYFIEIFSMELAAAHRRMKAWYVDGESNTQPLGVTCQTRHSVNPFSDGLGVAP